MSQQLFDEVIGDVPPSTVDVRTIVGRERRSRRLRRGMSGLAVVIALATVGGIVVAGGGTPASTVVGGSTATPVPEGKFRLVANDPGTAGNLRQAVDAAVRGRVPTATWLAADLMGRPNRDGEPPHLLFGSGTQLFYGGAGIALGKSRGKFSVGVVAPEQCVPGTEKCGNATPLFSCATPVPFRVSCVESSGPAGERVLTQTLSIRPPKLSGRWDLTSHEARVALADGRILTVLVDNEYDPSGGKAGPTQANPPLTAKDVTAIATAIGTRVAP